MKFKDLFLFLEQENDDWGAPLPADDEDLPGDQDPINPDDEGGMGPIDQNEPELPAEPDRPAKPKKLSATQQIKQKWLSQNPALTDLQMAEAIQFFRDRSGRLKEYHPYGYRNPDNNRHWINTPEITSLVQRFPEIEPTLSNLSKMLDLKNYPWEVMEFYMEMIQANNAIVREENIVISTELSFDEQLEIAKGYWTTQENLILNEGGVTIYKIESKQESVKWGAIQRILNEQRRAPQSSGGFDNGTGSLYWCTAVPPQGSSRSNLWGTYRPQSGFYYIWDQNKPYNPTDNNNSEGKYYCTSLMANRNGTFSTVDAYNGTISGREWTDIVDIFPILNGKQRLFPHFGETAKERVSVTLDAVTMRKGDKYYIGGLSDATKLAYVEDGRHINNVEAFSEMPFNVRKSYVNFTTLENDDIRTRFVCDDPDDAFGLLNFLYLENKPFNLYKFLHKDILQGQLGIAEGINSIKKLIIGNNFKRWITDDNSNHTLIANQTNKVTDKTKFGIMNIADGEFIKDVIYSRPPKTTELFARIVNVEGIDRKIPIVLQKYVATQGDANYDNEDYFYVFTTKDAMINRNSENYLKGQIFDGPEGEQFIEQQLAARTLISLSRRRG